MAEDNCDWSGSFKGLRILGMVNAGIWALSIAALIFVMRQHPGTKGLFPILAGGSAVATALVGRLRKLR